MKKVVLPLLAVLLFTACKKESTELFENEGASGSFARAAKMDVCHYDVVSKTWKKINIASNAWEAHRAHGDVRLDDQDGDGYVLANSCGFTGSKGLGDCNDTDASINPGAIEICNDGIDNNCNGQVDENCISSVTICNQVWMSKNLDVAKYRNGDRIPRVDNQEAWLSLTTGAYCYFNNDSATYAAIYGKLYNWYAINDPRGLAPTGWHVASDEDWNTLAACLGGGDVAGGKIKSVGDGLWIEPNFDASNSSGFTGLPGGYRSTYYGGGFIGVNSGAVWWTSTENSFAANLGLMRPVPYNQSALMGYSNDKRDGNSVRCVRN